MRRFSECLAGVLRFSTAGCVSYPLIVSRIPRSTCECSIKSKHAIQRLAALTFKKGRAILNLPTVVPSEPSSLLISSLIVRHTHRHRLSCPVARSIRTRDRNRINTTVAASQSVSALAKLKGRAGGGGKGKKGGPRTRKTKAGRVLAAGHAQRGQSGIYLHLL